MSTKCGLTCGALFVCGVAFQILGNMTKQFSFSDSVSAFMFLAIFGAVLLGIVYVWCSFWWKTGKRIKNGGGGGVGAAGLGVAALMAMRKRGASSGSGNGHGFTPPGMHGPES